MSQLQQLRIIVVTFWTFASLLDALGLFGHAALEAYVA
jgi:hypothetical protein